MKNVTVKEEKEKKTGTRARLFKKADVIIIAVCLLFAAVWAVARAAGAGKESLTAVVYVGGEEYTRIELSSLDGEISFEINGVVIAADRDSVYVESSVCADKICVGSGRLEKKGDSLACVPQRVAVTITGSGETDAQTY